MADRIGLEIVKCVRARQGRVRPHELIRELTSALGVSASAVKQALAALIERGEMTYAYRDPCSYVELLPEAAE